MGVQVGGSCLQFQLHTSQPSSPPQTLASIFSSCVSSSPNRRRRLIDVAAAAACHIDRSPFLGTAPAKLSRRRSLNDLRSRSSGGGGKDQVLRRAFSASSIDLDPDEDDDFLSRLQDSSSWPQPPAWDEIGAASVEMKANSVDLPMSLRIIKQKKKKKQQQQQRWDEEFREPACCSVNKAFSSMVFIVRELQTYSIQLREILFDKNENNLNLNLNLGLVLAKVQDDMNASFVWLFQHIFSCTPTLMLSLMLLLANFTVHSASPAFAAAPNPPLVSAEHHSQHQHQENKSRTNAPSIKSSLSGSRTSSVGGSGRGGGHVKAVAGATDDGQPGSLPTNSANVNEKEEDERRLWDTILEEASRMQATFRDEALIDPDTLSQLVSPVTAELEQDNYTEYSQTEMTYCKALSQDPDNVLLLSNFAQFLYLVARDHDRAEYYFKRAARVKPADAEALSRYANFLWLVKKDLAAAEETYLEAIDADPSNSYYAANYANFLWNTGGEDTCYPLDDECDDL